MALGAIVSYIGFYVFAVRIEYLAVFVLALFIAQGIDIDHYASAHVKIDCMVSLDANDCPLEMERGVFHDLTLYWFMKALVMGLFIGWNIHLRMDGIL